MLWNFAKINFTLLLYLFLVLYPSSTTTTILIFALFNFAFFNYHQFERTFGFCSTSAALINENALEIISFYSNHSLCARTHAHTHNCRRAFAQLSKLSKRSITHPQQPPHYTWRAEISALYLCSCCCTGISFRLP